MDYKVLKWKRGNKLKETMGIGFIAQIDFNLAKVYLLSDWSYLVMPFNPLSNWLVTHKLELMRKWIKERYFPVGEGGDTSYFERSHMLRNLASFKEELKEALCDLIFKNKRRAPADLSADEIDCIYEILKYRNLFHEFKLNFIILLGDYLINRRKDLDLSWGLLSDRQYLNPLMSLIIVTDPKRQGYYEIEKQLSIGQGYAGIEHYLRAVVLESKRQVEDMVEIVGVM
jgi:hypothetical protein